MTSPNSDLRGEIRRLGPWHHDVEVAAGVRTGGVTQPDQWMARLVADVFGDGLAGRSVLDCGCNAGGYLFAAAKLGAGRCFGFDVREPWIEQARFLARHLPSRNIEFAVHDLRSIEQLNLEPFDVSLFFGLFYHLPDPVAGLRIVANLTRELLMITTAFTRESAAEGLVLNRESRTSLLSGVHGLAWTPTSERVIGEILAWCGFPHARLRTIIDWPGHLPRLEILAARDERTFAHYDRVRGPAPEHAGP